MSDVAQVYVLPSIIGQVFILLTSRVMRAHLAVLFCARPRDSLEYAATKPCHGTMPRHSRPTPRPPGDPMPMLTLQV